MQFFKKDITAHYAKTILIEA